MPAAKKTTANKAKSTKAKPVAKAKSTSKSPAVILSHHAPLMANQPAESTTASQSPATVPVRHRELQLQVPGAPSLPQAAAYEPAMNSGSDTVTNTDKAVVPPAATSDKPADSAEVALPSSAQSNDSPASKPTPKPDVTPPVKNQPAQTVIEAPKSTPNSPSSAGDVGNPANASEALEVQAAERAEHDEMIQKLIDSKQYFLPINSVEKQKTKRFVALGILLSLVLALAWADIALDAGIIHLTGIKPVTHFFSN